MNNCQSCGMPMDKPEDYGGGRMGNPYCRYCSDEKGNLLPREIIREKMIQFQIQSLSKTPAQAASDVDKHMSLMPAWRMAVGQPFGGGPTTATPQSRPVSGPVGMPPSPITPPPAQTFAPPKPLESKPVLPGQTTTPLQPSVTYRPPTAMDRPTLGVDRPSSGGGPSLSGIDRPPSEANLPPKPATPPTRVTFGATPVSKPAAFPPPVKTPATPVPTGPQNQPLGNQPDDQPNRPVTTPPPVFPSGSQKPTWGPLPSKPGGGPTAPLPDKNGKPTS